MDPKERDQKIERWFGMWLRKEEPAIEDLFTPDCRYTESWGPEYRGNKAIEHWFREWNTRGRVIAWEIRRCTHSGARSYVEWFFEDRMDDGRTERFDGISVIEWQNGRIASLKEYGCRIPHYDPYNERAPQFCETEKSWF